MSQAIDRAAETLFSSTGPRVTNVKFFLGTARRVTGTQLAEQLLAAEAQIDAGLSRRIDPSEVDNYRCA